jgi:hypothetical protein
VLPILKVAGRSGRSVLLAAVLITCGAALPAQDAKGSKSAPEAVKVEGRCQARTKAGPQCKRKASAGSQYCYQHGGKKK